MMRAMPRPRPASVVRWALVFTFVAAGFAACSPKSVVVCEKLEGCGLLREDTDECVETIRKSFAEDGVDAEKLTKCIDCFGVKYCDEIRAGGCEEDCAEVLEDLRRRGILRDRDDGGGGEGGQGGSGGME
jgi:hypothetical protein